MHLDHDHVGSPVEHSHSYHTHPHDHDHDHHEHDHGDAPHTHEGQEHCAGADCSACGGCQHTPMEELMALMKYMVGAQRRPRPGAGRSGQAAGGSRGTQLL